MGVVSLCYPHHTAECHNSHKLVSSLLAFYKYSSFYLVCCLYRNIGCTDKNTVRDCLLEKSSEELAEAIPWIQYPSWGAMDLVVPPTKDLFIGPVLINDGKFYMEWLVGRLVCC